MNFDERLQKAIQRGQLRANEKAREARAKMLSEEELKRLHTKYRLELSEHIEQCVKRLPNHFPGFQYKTIYGEQGWGAGCSRDDLHIGSGGKRTTYYSRLEMTIRPISSYHVLDLAAKGTIANKEVFKRNHYELLSDADTEQFVELIDLWVLEYVELFAAKN